MISTPFAIRTFLGHLAAAALASSSWAADIVLTPPAGGGVSVTNAANTLTRLRVADDGSFTLPGLAAVAVPSTGLCLQTTTGKVGTCTVGTLTSLVAGAGLTGGTITGSGTIAIDPASATLTGNFFRQNGNSFAATAVLGTNDNQALEFKVNNSRIGRMEPNTTSPNIVMGLPLNAATSGVYGAVIGGGGETGTPSGASSFYVLSGQFFDCPLAGCFNRVTDAYGTIAGGVNNQAGDGAGTTTDRTAATVGGGFNNVASGLHSTVGGGGYNTASGSAPTGNSTGNTTVGGGYGNTASGDGSTVSGGKSNQAAGVSSYVGGGYGNQAKGDYSTVAGGIVNIASGYGSFAAGVSARTETGGLTPVVHNGVFIFADSSLSSITSFNSITPNEFAVRSTGGVRFVTAVNGTTGAPTAGVSVAAGGGSWSTISDRAAKKDLSPIDGRSVLAKLSTMPLYNWRYIAETSGAMHMGPVAQDFRAAFGLGDSDKTIATVDADGVALAAIQGLHRIVREQEARLVEQQDAIARLSARLADAESLKSEVVAVKAAIAEMLRDRASGVSRKASVSFGTTSLDVH